MRLILFLSITFIISVSCKIINVKTANELRQALLDAVPSDTIRIADGEYFGKFIAEKSGQIKSPITITGSKKAIISNNGYGFHLKADYNILKGFTITNSKKGLVLDGANHNILEKLSVHNIREEGIHFRLNSADNILRNSQIYKIGLTAPGFGEGVYIGSAVNNWKNNKPDKSDRNQVLNNKIGPNVAAEGIDIKEGSCCGIIRGNTFDGTGLSGENSADSWIDIKGDNYKVEDNVGKHTLLDGIQIHHIARSKIGGCNNQIKNNKCSGLPSNGRCVANLINRKNIKGECINKIQN